MGIQRRQRVDTGCYHRRCCGLGLCDAGVGAVSESQLLADILLACSRGDTRLMRTNSGVAWAGKIIHQDDRRITISPYHAVKLCPEGTADACGAVSTIITEAMLGQRVAIATGLELKIGRRQATPEQLAFGAMLVRLGGRWGIARSVDAARRILAGEKNLT